MLKRGRGRSAQDAAQASHQAVGALLRDSAAPTAYAGGAALDAAVDVHGAEDVGGKGASSDGGAGEAPDARGDGGAKLYMSRGAIHMQADSKDPKREACENAGSDNDVVPKAFEALLEVKEGGGGFMPSSSGYIVIQSRMINRIGRASLLTPP